MSTGIEGSIGLGRETVWKTGVASTRFISAQESITESRPRIREPMTFGTRETLPSDAGRLSYGGSITNMHVRPTVIGHLLRGVMGAYSVTGVGPFAHVFDSQVAKFSAEAALPPYTVTITRGPNTRRYLGGQISQLTLRQPNDDSLIADSDWLFGSAGAIAGETFTAEAGSRFLFSDLVILKNAVAFDLFEDVTIRINNNLDTEATLNGSRDPSAVDFNDKLVVTVEGTATLRSTALFDDFVADATDDYLFTWTSGTNILEVDCPILSLDSYTDPITGPGRLTSTFSFTAEFDSISGYATQVRLTNDLADYDAD